MHNQSRSTHTANDNEETTVSKDDKNINIVGRLMSMMPEKKNPHQDIWHQDNNRVPTTNLIWINQLDDANKTQSAV